MLFMGWFNVGPSCLTVPRELTYDGTLNSLRSNPVAELAKLREASLGSHQSPVTLAADGPPMSIFDAGKASVTSDMEMSVSVPAAGVSFGVAIMAADKDTAEIVLRVVVGPVAVSGLRTVNMSVTSASKPQAAGSFAVPGDEKTVAVRVLADRMLAEIFVASGRGVVAVPVAAPGKNTKNAGAFVFADKTSVTVESADAWDMGCGWARYP